MKKRDTALLILGLLLILGGLERPCWAQREHFILEGGMELDEEYTDNLYRVEKESRKDEDMITNLGLYLLSGYTTAKSRINLNYRPSFKVHKENGDDDFFAQNLKLDLRHDINRRFSLGLDEYFFKERERGESDLFSNRTRRSEFWVNRLSPGIQHSFSDRLFGLVKYQYEMLEFEEPEEEDSQEHRALFTLRYRLSPREDLDLDYQFWQRDFDFTSNYRAQQVTLGYQRKFKRTFSGEVRAGFQRKHFTEDQLDDIQAAVLHFALRREGRQLILSLSFDHGINDVGQDNSFFIYRRLALDLSYSFQRRLKLFGGGYFQNDDYDNERGLTHGGRLEKRDDDRWYLRMGAEYRLTNWLSLALEYNFERRESNLRGSDFDKNGVFFHFRTSHSTERRPMTTR